MIAMRMPIGRNRVTDRARRERPSLFWLTSAVGAALGAFGGAVYSPLATEKLSLETLASSPRFYLGTALVFLGIFTPRIIATILHKPNHNSLKLDRFMDGFKDAGILLRDFDPAMHGRKEIQEIRKQMSGMLARAMSSDGREARLVLYMVERSHEEERDAKGTTGGAGARFFKMECFGGRSDQPKNYIYNHSTEQGKFFCERMISSAQVLVNDAQAWRWSKQITHEPASSYRSFIVTPICPQNSEDQFPIGAVSIDYPGKSAFSPADTQLAWGIAALLRETMVDAERSANETRIEVADLQESLTNEEGF